MAYNKFTLDQVKEQFNLITDSTLNLFPEVNAVEVSSFLSKILEQFAPLALAINTEKARSELIVAPMLVELRSLLHNKISFFSGITFNVDTKEKLTGVCDFIISCSTEQYVLTAPVVSIVEAKNDNIINGLGQCIATMLAAQRFNEKKHHPITPIFGAVTSGTEWKFLQLEGQTVYIDLAEYYLHQPGKILAILMHMVTKATL